MNNYSSGFSLFELLIAISIATILSVMAAPAIGTWLDAARSESAQQQIYAMATEARTVALNRRQRVIVCHLEIDDTCSDTFSFPATTFVDQNGSRDFDAGETVRVTHIELSPATIELSDTSVGAADFLSFVGEDGTADAKSLCYTDQRSANNFSLVISSQGRLRITDNVDNCATNASTP